MDTSPSRSSWVSVAFGMAARSVCRPWPPRQVASLLSTVAYRYPRREFVCAATGVVGVVVVSCWRTVVAVRWRVVLGVWVAAPGGERTEREQGQGGADGLSGRVALHGDSSNR